MKCVRTRSIKRSQPVDSKTFDSKIEEKKKKKKRFYLRVAPFPESKRQSAPPMNLYDVKSSTVKS